MAFLFPKYFPFCPSEGGAVGPGTEYPFEMDLEDAMALYWKFLSLKITDNLVYSFIRTGEPESNCVATHTFSDLFDTLSYWPSKMSDMICEPYPYFYGIASGYNGIFTSSLSGNFPYETQGVYELLHSTDVIMKKINNQYKYYPRFILQISSDLEYAARYSTVNIGGISSEIVTLKANKSYKTNLYAAGSPEGPGLDGISLGGSIIIEKTSERIAE